MAESYAERNAALAEQLRGESAVTERRLDETIASLTDEERALLVTLRRLAAKHLIGDVTLTKGRMVAGRIEG